MMAPTEILAGQHYSALMRQREAAADCRILDRPVGRAGRKRKRSDGTGRRGIDILIGTHALIQEGVAFRLGLW